MTLSTLSSNLDANPKLVNDANPLDSKQMKLVNDANPPSPNSIRLKTMKLPLSVDFTLFFVKIDVISVENMVIDST